MALPKNIWNQIKNLTKREIIDALVRDNWTKDPSSKDATITYIKRLGTPDETGAHHKRIVIHFHPGDVCGPRVIKAILEDTGWTTEDLKV